MQAIVLYTTVGCHLCEQAEALLNQLPPETDIQWQKLDIADDPDLVDRYGIRIPVIRCEDDGRELGWPFDLDQLIRFLVRGQD